jgi:voltage-gated potassium channel
LIVKKPLLYLANRLWLILLIYVLSVLCSSALFAAFENRPFTDGLWWSFVTALTIGYGDLSPASPAGRVTGVLFGHFWIFGIVPLIVGNIVCKVLEDRNKFTHAEQEWQENALKAIAAKAGVELPPPPADY